ncbi:MAG: alkaline phosphatase family protein [Actinoallomurus sp.]
MSRFRTAALLGLALLSALAAPAPANAAAGLPRPDHVVVVVMENHSYSEIIGSSSAPYINSLASQGANFSQSFAVTHPSEPNYLELFSGSTQGVTDDSCPHTFSTPNLGSELIGAGLTFTGYSENMPSDGYTGCTSGTYARKHNPWVNFTNVPSTDNRTFAAFPTDYTTLPTTSFVVPDLCNDMHDCSISTGDTWLKNNIDAYAQWAKTHNSLLILTFDEDDSTMGNQIPTLFVGAGVTPGTYSEHITHDNVLRTIEDFYNLPYAGNSANASPITDVFGAGGGQNTVTVTNPGNQSTTKGTAVSLQIQATDSAAGQTLTYSATGLPAGLSINPATGLITGTPTTTGTSTVTVTAIDTTNASGSVTFTWRITKH